MSLSIIATLRGITPAEVPAIADALIESGITRLEVPLKAPEALDSIRLLARSRGETAQIGAGGVLSIQEVRAAAKAGANAILSPNTDTMIITETCKLGLASYPGAATPTECLTAIRAGATALRLFPAFLIGPRGMAAFRPILPDGVPILAAGGVAPTEFGEWIDAGASGFCIASALYRAGDRPEAVRLRARILISALENPM